MVLKETMLRRYLLLWFLLFLAAASRVWGEGPQNLDLRINTRFHEAMPCISGNGKTLIYQTNRSLAPEEQLDSEEENWDLWISYLTDDGKWSQPSIMEGINSDYFDGHASLSADGSRLYFTSNRPRGGNNTNIWSTYLTEEGSWADPQPLPEIINGPGSESFPSLSADGSRLYFTRSDGIYASDKVDNSWGIPVKLPSVINSGNAEAAPMIHVDNRTLYFSSKRPGGFGGYDIYLSRFENNRWSKAENLGAVVNGPGNDLFVSIPASGELLYFASVRKGGFGGEDIYSVKLPPKFAPRGVTLVQGKIIHQKSRKPVAAKIQIYDFSSQKVIESIHSSLLGEYAIILSSGKKYGVIVESSGFFFLSEFFDLTAEKYYRQLNKNFELLLLSDEGALTLRNIFFQVGSSTLLRESYHELNKLAQLLLVNKYLALEVQGHTDNLGNEVSNQKLSLQRAVAVSEYLILQGVDGKRLLTKGAGSSKPIASNHSEEGRLLNRRTDFRIIQNN